MFDLVAHCTDDCSNCILLSYDMAWTGASDVLKVTLLKLLSLRSMKTDTAIQCKKLLKVGFR